MAFQVVGLAKIGLVSPEGLLFNGFDSRRKQSVQPQRLAFEQGKSCAVVQGRSFQQRAAPEMCGEPGWHLGVIDYGHGNFFVQRTTATESDALTQRAALRILRAAYH